MQAALYFLVVVLPGYAPSHIKPRHAENVVYAALQRKGLTLEGTPVSFPEPILHDGRDAESQRRALEMIAGSENKAKDLLRDSITAPFTLKIHDIPARSGATIRVVELWFVVYGELDEIDTNDVAERFSKSKPTEVGNMRFEAHLLDDKQLTLRNLHEIRAGNETPGRTWYVHQVGRLLGRIEVEATDQVVLSRSDESIVIATRTSSEFAKDADLPNRWRSMTRKGEREDSGKAEPYAGGAGYVKISRLVTPAKALLVEAHFAFLEPRAWFDGAPVLRSKIGLVAQDQIRRLRREIVERRQHPATKDE